MVALAFLLCCAIWGSTFLAIRIGTETLPPVWGAVLRLLIAAPLLGLIAVAMRSRWPRGAALRGALALGALNYGVNFSLLYWGQLTVPSGIAAVFYATVPLSTALLAPLLGVEALSPRKVAASIVAVAGVAVIFAGELSLDVPLAGLLAIFAAATAVALSSVIFKAAPRQDTVPANAVGALAGLPICLAASLALGEQRVVPTTLEPWIPILYLVFAGSLGAYLLYTWLLKTWSVTNASYIGVIVPIVAVILGAIVRQERPAALTFVGAALVIGAVVYALRPNQAVAAPAPPR